jgi:hypothetical protein
MQAKGRAFLVAQLGKGYSEDPGKNFGPYTWDCQGLAFGTYKAAAGLVTGPGIGLIGSAAQFNDSTVKLQPSDPWLVLDQVFFYGGETSGPRPGHTGVYVGPVVPGGAPMMINAYDTARGVIYSEFDPIVGGPGFSITGRTRPLLLVPHVDPPAPPKPRTAPTMFLLLNPADKCHYLIGAKSTPVYLPQADYSEFLAKGVPEIPCSAVLVKALFTP